MLAMDKFGTASHDAWTRATIFAPLRRIERVTSAQDSFLNSIGLGLAVQAIAHRARYGVAMAASVVRSRSQGFLTTNRTPGTAARLLGAQVPVPA